MSKIADNLTQVRQRIQQCALAAHRDPYSIDLLAVSKTRPASAVETAYHAQQRDFGENYLQEALQKIERLNHLEIVWHFIGPIQSNKTRAIAEHFCWVHTVDRVKVAQRLSQQRPPHLAPLQICLQVNIDEEKSKAGCTVNQALPLIRAFAELPNLRIRGLMAIPLPHNSETAFQRLAQLQHHLRKESGLALDTLSMGMSDDLGPAIAAGATIVRVGTAIFGARDNRQSAPDHGAMPTN